MNYSFFVLRFLRTYNSSHSASCETSPVYGKQTLRSGEEAFCDEGWTVSQIMSVVKVTSLLIS